MVSKRQGKPFFMKEEINHKKPTRKLLKVYIGFNNKKIISNSTKSMYLGVVGADARLQGVEEWIAGDRRREGQPVEGNSRRLAAKGWDFHFGHIELDMLIWCWSGEVQKEPDRKKNYRWWTCLTCKNRCARVYKWCWSLRFDEITKKSMRRKTETKTKESKRWKGKPEEAEPGNRVISNWQTGRKKSRRAWVWRLESREFQEEQNAANKSEQDQKQISGFNFWRSFKTLPRWISVVFYS